MIDIKAHFDREKENSGLVIIHAKASVPDLCSDLEIIVTHIVKGLVKQLPEYPDRCHQAAVMFAIAAAEGAKRGLEEYEQEAQL